MPENIVPMMMLYLWLGVGFARDAVIERLRSEGMDDAAIEGVLSKAIGTWRIRIVAAYVSAGLVMTLIRKLMPNDAALGLVFSLGGALLVTMAILAIRRLFLDPGTAQNP